MEHAAYLAGPDYKATKKNLPPSAAPRHDDPLSRHRLSYLPGGGGSGKTTRSIELFRTGNPLVFTPTHRLVKEMRARGVRAQTYHSFFRYSGAKHARATEEDLVLLQSKPEYLGKTLKVFRAETNWEAGEALLLEIDSNVAPGLDLGGDEIPAEEVAFVSREEGGLLQNALPPAQTADHITQKALPPIDLPPPAHRSVLPHGETPTIEDFYKRLEGLEARAEQSTGLLMEVMAQLVHNNELEE